MRLFLVSLSIAAAVLFSNCSTAPQRCVPGACAGCCDEKGECVTGNTLALCGSGGAACQQCRSNEACSLGQCFVATTGGGGGSSTGGGGGATGGGGNTTDGGNDGGAVDGGTDAGVPDSGIPDAGQGAFILTTLDAAAVDATSFAIAIDPPQERVGVAYFTNRGTQTSGMADFDLKYLEWRQGVVSPVQTIVTVQRKVGVALVFSQGTGEPIVSYLGGGSGGSAFWLQSDAVINRRGGGSTWTETVVATTGDQITCGNGVSDRGLLVGLWPALALDSTGKLYLAYRDAHDGQFPTQDWAGSDVELWEGTPPPTTGVCLAEGGNNKDAWGGHNQLVMGAADQPAIIYDQMYGTADTNGTNVIFQKRSAAGSWSAPARLLTIANTQTGASLAYDPQEGFGIAVVDRATNQLGYLSSVNGITWSALDPVFGAGSGGWYPSLAMDPVNHEPAIAFYVCHTQSGANETGCPTSADRLVVSQRVVGTWRETLVDVNGGYQPKLGFFASGKRLIVYRTPPAVDSGTGLTVAGVGVLKIAVER